MYLQIHIIFIYVCVCIFMCIYVGVNFFVCKHVHSFVCINVMCYTICMFSGCMSKFDCIYVHALNVSMCICACRYVNTCL
ncbi:hypothetical protein FKM82_026570 [Ascaphus truei]